MSSQLSNPNPYCTKPWWNLQARKRSQPSFLRTNSASPALPHHCPAGSPIPQLWVGLPRIGSPPESRFPSKFPDFPAARAFPEDALERRNRSLMPRVPAFNSMRLGSRRQYRTLTALPQITPLIDQPLSCTPLGKIKQPIFDLAFNRRRRLEAHGSRSKNLGDASICSWCAVGDIRLNGSSISSRAPDRNGRGWNQQPGHSRARSTGRLDAIHRFY